MLQKVESLLQRRQLHFAKTKSVKQSVNRVPADVLPTIVEETTDLTADPLEGVEVTEQSHDHSRNIENPESSALGWHLNREILCWNNW